MPNKVKLIVNGKLYERYVEPYQTLLNVLRYDLGLTGTKSGCGMGECGSCTVLLDGKPVSSCLMLASCADEKHITTIEGLADGEHLHPLQKAFIESGAIQCGFCTPGMILTAKALLTDNPHAGEDEIRLGLVGNLCRCSGYIKIVEAVMAADREMHAQGRTDQ